MPLMKVSLVLLVASLLRGKGSGTSIEGGFKQVNTHLQFPCPTDPLYTEFLSRTLLHCAMLCTHYETCRRFQFYPVLKFCRLFEFFHINPPNFHQNIACSLYDRDNCPVDFQFESHSKSCLRIVQGQFKWDEAQQTCIALNAYLATPRDSLSQIGMEKYLTFKHTYLATLKLWLGAQRHNNAIYNAFFYWKPYPGFEERLGPINKWGYDLPDNDYNDINSCLLLTHFLTPPLVMWSNIECSNRYLALCQAENLI